MADSRSQCILYTILSRLWSEVEREQGKQQGPDPVPTKENRKLAINYKMLDCAFGLLVKLCEFWIFFCG